MPSLLGTERTSSQLVALVPADPPLPLAGCGPQVWHVVSIQSMGSLADAVFMVMIFISKMPSGAV